MVLSYALSLNCHQQNGNLAIVPLGGAFCSATFKKRSGGLIDVDLWQQHNNSTIQRTCRQLHFRKNYHVWEKICCCEALEHSGKWKPSLHYLFSNSEKLFIGQTVKYLLDHHINNRIQSQHCPACPACSIYQYKLTA